jgi:hypothetical protein
VSNQNFCNDSTKFLTKNCGNSSNNSQNSQPLVFVCSCGQVFKHELDLNVLLLLKTSSSSPFSPSLTSIRNPSSNSSFHNYYSSHFPKDLNPHKIISSFYDQQKNDIPDTPQKRLINSLVQTINILVSFVDSGLMNNSYFSSKPISQLLYPIFCSLLEVIVSSSHPFSELFSSSSSSYSSPIQTVLSSYIYFPPTFSPSLLKSSSPSFYVVFSYLLHLCTLSLFLSSCNYYSPALICCNEAVKLTLRILKIYGPLVFLIGIPTLIVVVFPAYIYPYLLRRRDIDVEDNSSNENYVERNRSNLNISKNNFYIKNNKLLRESFAMYFYSLQIMCYFIVFPLIKECYLNSSLFFRMLVQEYGIVNVGEYLIQKNSSNLTNITNPTNSNVNYFTRKQYGISLKTFLKLNPDYENLLRRFNNQKKILESDISSDSIFSPKHYYSDKCSCVFCHVARCIGGEIRKTDKSSFRDKEFSLNTSSLSEEKENVVTSDSNYDSNNNLDLVSKIFPPFFLETISFFFSHSNHFPSFHSSFPQECKNSFSFFEPNNYVDIHKSQQNIFNNNESNLSNNNYFQSSHNFSKISNKFNCCSNINQNSKCNEERINDYDPDLLMYSSQQNKVFSTSTPAVIPFYNPNNDINDFPRKFDSLHSVFSSYNRNTSNSNEIINISTNCSKSCIPASYLTDSSNQNSLNKSIIPYSVISPMYASNALLNEKNHIFTKDQLSSSNAQFSQSNLYSSPIIYSPLMISSQCDESNEDVTNINSKKKSEKERISSFAEKIKNSGEDNDSVSDLFDESDNNKSLSPPLSPDEESANLCFSSNPVKRMKSASHCDSNVSSKKVFKSNDSVSCKDNNYYFNYKYSNSFPHNLPQFNNNDIDSISFNKTPFILSDEFDNKSSNSPFTSLSVDAQQSFIFPDGEKGCDFLSPSHVFRDEANSKNFPLNEFMESLDSYNGALFVPSDFKYFDNNAEQQNFTPADIDNISASNFSSNDNFPFDDLEGNFSTLENMFRSFE